MRAAGWLSVMAIVLILALASYIGMYVRLSLHGRYEPACIGLGGVKWYDWAPQGFVTGWTWHPAPMLLFAPCYAWDLHCWHTQSQCLSGRFPMHRYVWVPSRHTTTPSPLP